MSLSNLLAVMMEHYGDIRLSEHALKAFAYARGIGGGEELPGNDLFILSAAAILHDIGIPRAIELHGSAAAEFQEKEGALLAPEKLALAGIQNDIADRVAWLVGHHHTADLAGGDLLLQILMEADYLVNLAEGRKTAEDAAQIRDAFFKTKTGQRYISALFSLPE
jgi:HD superfamily phosphodiesterase